MEQELDSFRANLSAILQHEVSCATILLASLEGERKALSTMDESLISATNSEKQQLLDDLQKATNKRITIMSEYGYESSNRSLNSFFQSNSSTADLNVLYVKLSELAQYCFTENRLIGQLINRRTQFISQALGNLSPSIEQKSFTYSQNGNSQNQSFLRNLGTV